MNFQHLFQQELYKCPKTDKACDNKCKQLKPHKKNIYMKFGNTKFYKVTSINELFLIFTENKNLSYILNGGNTAHGKKKNNNNLFCSFDYQKNK